MPMRPRAHPPATEPHIFWWGNASSLVDRVLAVEEKYRATDGLILSCDVADDLLAMVNADWDPTSGRPRVAPEPGA